MIKKRKKSWQKPVITRIKLNPEQAVLSCCEPGQRSDFVENMQCYMGGNCGVSQAVLAS